MYLPATMDSSSDFHMPTCPCWTPGLILMIYFEYANLYYILALLLGSLLKLILIFS